MDNSELYSSSDVVGLCHCTDGCMAPIVVVKTKSNKLVLYGISEVRGMGMGLWHKRITNDEYDKVVPFNTDSGISHIAVCKNDKWQLVEIIDDNTAACKIKLFTDLNFNSMEEIERRISEGGRLGYDTP